MTGHTVITLRCQMIDKIGKLFLIVGERNAGIERSKQMLKAAAIFLRKLA